MSTVEERWWPSVLEPGSLVAVVAPSGPTKPDRLARGVALLESWGLRVRVGPCVRGRHDQLSYLSAGDSERADELTRAWTDPDVAAVWAARGGCGVQRMIDRLDFDLLRAAGPKLLLGYSDITALHTRFGRELDLITFHAPVVAGHQWGDSDTTDRVRELIFTRPEPGAELIMGQSLVAGSGSGRLIGGNLAMLVSDLGVEPAPEVPSVLIIEDVDEEGYRVDRMLTQLRRSGWLSMITAVVLGDFTETDDDDQLRRVFLDRLGELGVPVMLGAPVGHGTHNLTLPLGAEVILTVDAGHGRMALTA